MLRLEKTSPIKRIVKSNIDLYIKSKQLPLVEKCVCLIILSVNSNYKFSAIYLLYSLNFTTNKQQLFQYEPISLDVNEVYLEEEQNILNRREKLRKRQNITEWCRCGK